MVSKINTPDPASLQMGRQDRRENQSTTSVLVAPISTKQRHHRVLGYSYRACRKKRQCYNMQKAPSKANRLVS